ERHALAEQTLNLRYPFVAIGRMEQVPHGDLEVPPALHGDFTVGLDVRACFLDLLAEDIFIERHYYDVVEIEVQSRVVKNADDVREVVQLVFGEEFIVQIERPEDHVHLRHVVLVCRVERVVQAREVRARRIDQTQIAEPAGPVDVRQQFVEEVEVALSVEDHHRNLVTVLSRSNSPGQILGDDVSQKSRLAAARHADDNS